MHRRRNAGRRPTGRYSLQLLFVAALLLLGLVVPFLSSLFARPRVSVAASSLPTARVLTPTPQAEMIVETSRDVGEATAGASSSLSTPLPAAPTQTEVPAATEAAPLPTAQPLGPTLTPTPVPLAPVGPADAARPVPTLFPTLPATVPPQAPGGVPLEAPPPILMYHYVRAVDEAGDPLGYNLSVTPDDFERQIAWLSEQGYHSVRMDMLARCLGGEVACPAKPIAITFDDGYEDAYTAALPVLQRHGMVATFYIISGLVGQPGYMSWEQLAAMRDAGMELGGHTVNHYDLTSLDWTTAGYEIGQVKADLEQRLAIKVASFCYPTGLYNGGIEEQARAAGYTSATTTRWDGDYSDIMALPRRRVAGGTALEGFAAIVAG